MALAGIPIAPSPVQELHAAFPASYLKVVPSHLTQSVLEQPLLLPYPAAQPTIAVQLLVSAYWQLTGLDIFPRSCVFQFIKSNFLRHPYFQVSDLLPAFSALYRKLCCR